jgi:hypothetical protein
MILVWILNRLHIEPIRKPLKTLCLLSLLNQVGKIIRQYQLLPINYCKSIIANKVSPNKTTVSINKQKIIFYAKIIFYEK